MTDNIDDVAQTLAEYERLAISSGATVQIDPPEFMGEASAGEWAPIWLDTCPDFARATVHRDGIPTQVYVSWDESLPAEDSWRALWERKPMKLFGAYALRAALRRAFRDVIGDRREPDEKPAVGEPSAEPVVVDWGLAIEGAASVAVLDELWAKMREERARTGALEKAYRERRAELVEAEWKSDATPFVDMSPISAASVSQRVEGQYLMNGPRQPQDHKPPQNRAARRASKKGRRS